MLFLKKNITTKVKFGYIDSITICFMLNSCVSGMRNSCIKPVPTLRTDEVFCKSTAVAKVLKPLLGFHSRVWFMSKCTKHKSSKASKPKFSTPQHYLLYKTKLFQLKHSTLHKKSGPQTQVLLHSRVMLGANRCQARVHCLNITEHPPQLHSDKSKYPFVLIFCSFSGFQ